MWQPITTLICSVFLLLSCSEEQEMNHCIDLTVDPALYDALVLENINDSLGSPQRVLMDPQSGYLQDLKNEDCFGFIFQSGYGKPSEVDYKLVWNGQFSEDTIHLYFYFIHSDFKESNYMGMRLYVGKKYFTLSKIRERLGGDNRVIHIHYRENRREQFIGSHIINI